LDVAIPRGKPRSLAESDYSHAQQNRASTPPVRTPKLALPCDEARDTLIGPINTYSLEPVGGQMQDDPQNAVTGLQSNMNNELKRKIKPDTMVGTDSELITRKKVKVSVVPAVNLYE